LKIDRYAPIYCDSADANRIEELFEAGYNVYKSNKDIDYGIQCVKSYNIFVSSDSANILKEIAMYKYMTDKNGNAVEKPLKFNDHAMDAMRYAVATHMQTVGEKNEFRIIKTQ
jgi:phage terminase large subunit